MHHNYSHDKKALTITTKLEKHICIEMIFKRNIVNLSRILIDLYEDVVPKIGLEVHAQLDVHSKLFSQGAYSSQAPPNSGLDLLDIALPGSLPKLNRAALRAAILTSLGLNCSVQNLIHFDRKNYFYPDMPAGFQITQFDKPVAKDGYIDFIATTYHRSVIAHNQLYDVVKYLYSDDRVTLEEFEPYIKRSHIKQIQLEQDSAKTLYQLSEDSERETCNLIDYSRSGTSLIEIVFEPDLTTHHEASSLIKELSLTLKSLGTSKCELQEGSMRVDANVSILKIGDQELDSARVELKNLNSLRSLNYGIFHEIKRQSELIKAGGSVLQETRTFDTKKQKTVPLRLKEESVDYRYVPEPSLPPLRIDQKTIEEIRNDLPHILPQNLRDHLQAKYRLDLILISELVEEPGLSEYMDNIMEGRPDYNPNVVADFLIYFVSNLKDIPQTKVLVDLSQDSVFCELLSPVKLQILFDMMFQEEISYSTAYEVIKLIFTTCDTTDPREIVKRLEWHQINDMKQIGEICNDCIKKMKNISKKYGKRGEKRFLRMMLEKICELHNSKINIRKSIEYIDSQIKPKKDC